MIQQRVEKSLEDAFRISSGFSLVAFKCSEACNYAMRASGKYRIVIRITTKDFFFARSL
jgi:hypothetical protein